MKNILLLTLCCCFLLIGESCKKSETPISEPDPPYNPVDDLPDAHNSPNRSVFGCLIDGEVWKPSWGFNNPSYTYHDPTGQFNISAKNLSDNKFEQIGFVVKFSSTGDFKNLHPTPYANEKFCNEDFYWEYALDTTSYNNVTIESFFEEDGVIIGTFEFTAINNECPSQSDTVKITEGRFKATL